MSYFAYSSSSSPFSSSYLPRRKRHVRFHVKPSAFALLLPSFIPPTLVHMVLSSALSSFSSSSLRRQPPLPPPPPPPLEQLDRSLSLSLAWSDRARVKGGDGRREKESSGLPLIRLASIGITARVARICICAMQLPRDCLEESREPTVLCHAVQLCRETENFAQQPNAVEWPCCATMLTWKVTFGAGKFWTMLPSASLVDNFTSVSKGLLLENSYIINFVILFILFIFNLLLLLLLISSSVQSLILLLLTIIWLFMFLFLFFIYIYLFIYCCTHGRWLRFHFAL